MSLKSVQITLVASTITPLLVQGTGSGTTFINTSGSLTDQLPVQIKNTDATATVYIGSTNVSATNGYPLLAGQSISMGLVGASDLPYAFSTGTPVVAVLAGRQ